MIRSESYFTGHVQGVGFRYQALQTAKEFEVTGTVENLPDGRVRLLAEGRPGEVRGFVAELADRMASFIRQTDTQEFPVSQKRFDSFLIL